MQDDQRDRALIARIEDMSYEDMVRHMRFAPVGDPMFQGESNTVFVKKFNELEAAQPRAARAAVSKRVGWEKPKEST